MAASTLILISRDERISMSLPSRLRIVEGALPESTVLNRWTIISSAFVDMATTSVVAHAFTRTTSFAEGAQGAVNTKIPSRRGV